MANLLEVRNLATYFFQEDSTVKAVDDISFDLEVGETLALVGESGCGKSISALSIMKLVPDPPGKIVSGEVLFNGGTWGIQRAADAAGAGQRDRHDLPGAHDVAEPRAHHRPGS